MGIQRFVAFASVISEIEQSDIFMTVKARILEAPKANLNGARVTVAFVDDIIANKERYIGLPLYADKKALDSGKFNRLGHLYDSKTGEFHSTQIGSFYDFEKEEIEGGCALVGYARIPKRDMSLSKAIAELFAEGRLKFSFEIACSDYTELEDGTFEIDASENNYLEGTAIVTFPACENAVALEFVAQSEADDTNRGDEEMAETEKAVAEEIVETETAEATPQTAEDQQDQIENAEGENAACDKKDEKAEETASVYVTEVHTESIETYAYDTETHKNVNQSVVVRTSVSDEVPGEIVEADDGIHIAEADGDGGDSSANSPAEAPTEPEADNTDPVEPAETDPVEFQENPVEPAEEAPAANDEEAIVEDGESKKIAETLAALTETIKNLTAEVNALKEERKGHEVASRNVVAESINPFVDSINALGTKYDLLQKDSPAGSYTLLSK